MARKYIKSKHGLFGMVYYYDENGNPIGKSRPGLIEGTKVYTDQNGGYAGKSRPGILAKEVFTDTDHNHITSYHNPSGESHFKNGVPIGNSRSGLLGSSHTLLEAEDEIQEDEFYECESDITEDLAEEMQYAECEDEGHEEYISQTTRRTVVKKRQFFVMCFVICVVVACIYAIIKL